MAFSEYAFGSAADPLSGEAEWVKQGSVNVASAGQASGGRYVSTEASTADQAAVYQTAFGEDQFAQSEIVTFGSGTIRVGLLLRCDESGTDQRGLLVRYTGSAVELKSWNSSGTRSDVDSFAYSSFANGDYWRAEVIGNTVTVYRQAGGSGAFTSIGTLDASGADWFNPGNPSAPGIYVVENGTTQSVQDN